MSTNKQDYHPTGDPGKPNRKNGNSCKTETFFKILPLAGAIARYRRSVMSKRDYEFLPATLEVIEAPPAPFSRMVLLFVILFSTIMIAWACIARMDIVVNGMGVVIPKGKVKTVQSLESGIVTAIHVRDGQKVKKGDLLISMDNRDNLADLDSIDKELVKAELTTLRLEAELSGDPELFSPSGTVDAQAVGLHRKLLQKSLAAHTERLLTLDIEVKRCRAERDSLEFDVKRLEESLPLTIELFDKRSALAERKLISKAELLQARLEINDQRHNLSSARSRLEEVEARLKRAQEEKELTRNEYHRDLLDRLAEAKNSCENLRNRRSKARNKQQQLQLRAPVDGIVQQLSVTTVGGVVTSAQSLLVVVPVECGLEIEARIPDKDIGFVLPEQQVSVKVNAYPFTRYGDLEGRIEWVAGDSVMDDQMGAVYPVKVAVENYTLPNVINGKQGVIAPGMTVVADIKVGQRRVIDYFLGPIIRYRDQSLREI